MKNKIVNNQISYASKELENIELSRQEFKKVYKKHDIVKYIVLVIAFAIMIVSLVVVPKAFEPEEGQEANKLGTILMFAGVLFGLLILAIQSLISTKLKKKAMEKYFASFYKNFNDEVYNKDSFTYEVKNEKLELEEFNASRLYNDVYSLPNRNSIDLTYKNKKIRIVDAAAQIKDQKQLTPKFVGKFLISENTYYSDDGIIIYFKASNDKLALPPTNTSFAEVENNDKYIIYSNNSDWKKYITKKVSDAFARLNMDSTIIDASVSIQKGKTYICVGIDDELMVIPFKEPFKQNATLSFKEHISSICDIISEIK